MKNIDPAFMRTYIAVAETGSLTLAAKLIGKTIAALSYQITQLESALGQKLFIRGWRGMALSEEGHRFLLEARFLLQAHDQIADHQKRASSSPPANSALKRVINTRQSTADTSTRSINGFKDNLETNLLRSTFSMWQSYRADGKVLSLDDLTKSGVISLLNHNALLMDTDQSEFRCVGASDLPTRLFQLDKYGFGMTFDQAWKSPKISESRRKIFSICKNADAPVFFSGNAPVPWHSSSYYTTIDRFVSTRLDRLLIPVKINSDAGERSGVLQIAEFRDRLCIPVQRSSTMSEEEQAASLNFIGNVSVAISR